MRPGKRLKAKKPSLPQPGTVNIIGNPPAKPGDCRLYLERIRHELKDVLLGPAGLYEALREKTEVAHVD